MLTNYGLLIKKKKILPAINFVKFQDYVTEKPWKFVGDDLTVGGSANGRVNVGNIGILNGIIFAVISSLIVQLWFQDIQLSLIISISMILTMVVAGLFGILVPVTLKKMNIDPAIASSVFVTTITDVIGFVSFLGVGAYFL